MIIDDKAKAALQDPDTKAVAIEMTEERKAHFKRVCNQIQDLLRANTRGPLEAYAMLQFLVHSFEETYGIRGGIILDKGDQKH